MIVSTLRGLNRRRVIGALVVAVGVVVAALVINQSRETSGRRVPVGLNPVAVAVDDQTERAFVLSRGLLNSLGEPTGPGNVTVIDSETGAIVNTTEVGRDPTAIAVDKSTGRVFVVNRGAYDTSGHPSELGTVSVLDARSGRVLRTIGVGKGPQSITVDERLERVVVVNSGIAPESGSVSILDGQSGTVLGKIAVDSYPADAAVDSTEGLVFVANFLSNTVSILDLQRMRVAKTVTLGSEPGTLAKLVLDERTAHVYALSFSYPPVIPGGGPSNGKVTMINARNGEILNTVVMTNATAIALSSRTGHVLVTWSQAQKSWLTALDAERGNILWSVRVGEYPYAIGVNERLGRILVINWKSGTVSVLEAQDGKSLCTRTVGERPVAIAVSGQTDKVFIVSAKDNSVSIWNSMC